MRSRKRASPEAARAAGDGGDRRTIRQHRRSFRSSTPQMREPRRAPPRRRGHAPSVGCAGFAEPRREQQGAGATHADGEQRPRRKVARRRSRGARCGHQFARRAQSRADGFHGLELGLTRAREHAREPVARLFSAVAFARRSAQLRVPAQLGGGRLRQADVRRGVGSELVRFERVRRALDWRPRAPHGIRAPDLARARPGRRAQLAEREIDGSARTLRRRQLEQITEEGASPRGRDRLAVRRAGRAAPPAASARAVRLSRAASLPSRRASRARVKRWLGCPPIRAPGA
jgi:hypothetical protein